MPLFYKTIKTIFAFFISIAWLSAQSLPSDLTFTNWEDKTDYTKVYHVSKHHPEASDGNPGTFEKPFLTINKAASVLKPTEKVIIHSGVYHEFVRPANGGKDEANMIMYEGAAGEEVIITGAKKVTSLWKESLHRKNEKAYSKNMWEVPLDSVLDMSKPNPFNQRNATSAQMKIMSWATDLDGTAPFTFVRGMVLQNEKRLIQLAHYGDLARMDGTFWVDTLDRVLHINPYGFADPNKENIEITALEQLFKPQEIATSYIHLKGLTFCKAGNGFMRTGVGAVFSNGGNHWMVEENIVHTVNSVAIEIGIRFTEDRKMTKQEAKTIKKNRGGMLILNNKVYNCGTGGIQGLHNYRTKVEGNHIFNIGWQDTENYWECAGVKLLVCEETIVNNNKIHDVMAANAIWLDWNNKNSRVTSNLIYDMKPARGGAIFIEASRLTPNWIDHNILYNVHDIAISVYDSDRTETFNNLIANAKTPYISKVITQGRVVDGRPLTSENNVLLHNIFYQNESLPYREGDSNKAYQNIFVGMDFEEFKKQDWGHGNEEWEMEIEFDNDKIKFITEKLLPSFESRIALPDFHGNNKDSKTVKPGPFQLLMELEKSYMLW